MKSFKQFILKEGGNAVPGTSRINKANVQPTLDDLYKKMLPALKLSSKSVSLLGTTGKKDTSGDIDLAVDIQALMKASKLSVIDDLYDFMYAGSKKISSSVKDTRGLGTISFGFPITNKDGQQSGKLVQIDLFLVSNLPWANWIYYGPGEAESKLKGFYRNILLGEVAKQVSVTVTKKQGAEEVERKRLLFNFSQGLMKAVQSRKGKKSLLKNFKTITRELVSADPKEVAEMLFGKGTSPESLLTFEQVYAAINSRSFPFKNKKNDIFRETKKGLVRMGVPIPDVLEKY